MDSPDKGISSSISPEDKKDLIASITEKDKKAFYEWSANPSNQGKLALPEAALRYMLIPPRVLELSTNPEAVGLDIYETHFAAASALVVEHKSTPVSDMISRRKYLEEKEMFLKSERDKQGNPIVFIIPETGGLTLPQDVDPYHIEDKYRELVKSGIFSPNDYFINNIQLYVTDNPQAIYVGDYRIRDAFQKSGIGTSFYTRLRECAKQLGFRFITGRNWENNNIVYFRDKLGRFTLDQVRPEKREDFSNTTSGLEYYSIDFLYSEDKAIYIRENP